MQKARLSEIFFAHRGHVSDKWEHYLNIYETELASLISNNRPISVLEIGVQNGGSLEIWQKYLPEGSTITGIDVDPLCANIPFDPGIEVIIGDASKKDALDAALGDRTFDLIIDDGSHYSHHIVATFRALFPRLRLAGKYIIEDMHACYFSTHGGAYKHPTSAIEYLKNAVDWLNTDYFDATLCGPALADVESFPGKVARVSFYDSVAVIENLAAPKVAPYRRILTGQQSTVLNPAVWMAKSPALGLIQAPEGTARALEQSLREQLDALRRKAESAQTTIAALEMQLAEERQVSSSAKKDLLDQAAKAEGELQKMQAEIERQTGVIAELTTRASDAEGALATANGALTSLKSQMDRVDRQAQVLRASAALWRQEDEIARQALLTVERPHVVDVLEQPIVQRKRRRGLKRLRERWRVWLAERAFDPDFYRQQYPDVAASGIDPFRHYLKTGWREGRDPVQHFSTAFYLEANEDVRHGDSNPFVHYVNVGRAQGRKPNGNDRAPQVGGSLRSWARRNQDSYVSKRFVKLLRKRRAKREFDPKFYLEQYPDIAAAKVDPFRHYMQQGWREERDPTSWFSTADYMQSNPDVRASGVNPFFHYVNWGRDEGRSAKGRMPEFAAEIVDTVPAEPVALLKSPPLATKPARVIAFYLPQFHPIPENDEWWGKGFTEWTNVRPAKPHFKGHYQPHVPGELGYYNLLDPGVQQRQVELAKLYGIDGFCFYLYWFGGHRLLEKPVDKWLADASLDLPFCVCWANENWSRRWDGLESEVLMAQNHSPEDDLAFIAEVARYLRDPRYICIDGRPLLLVYRPELLPSAKETASRWRDWCRQNGVGEIHLAYTQSFEQVDPSTYGFDAAIEFPPNRSGPPDLTHVAEPLGSDFAMKVYDWRVLHERSKTYSEPGYPLYRSVCLNWDNTARRKNRATAFVNHSPELYREWLSNAIAHTRKTFGRPDQRLIFVNAWNEWAEGSHLEPDQRYGYAWLQATRDALEEHTRRIPEQGRVVVVAHDAHPHGAQFLALNMARTFKELGFTTDMIVLGDGPLLPRYAEVATVHQLRLDAISDQEIGRKLRDLRDGGADFAIANTTVSGLLVPHLKKAGLRTISLIHELPGILKSYKLEPHAAAIREHADKVVFAADHVRHSFEDFIGAKVEQAVIRPQGSYNRFAARPRGTRALDRRTMKEKLGLSPDVPVLICVGYGDSRKGFDLFVDVCLQLLRAGSRVTPVWVGNIEGALKDEQMAHISRAGYADRFVFTGLVSNPLDFYAAADVYALTSREDPFPSVVLEAMDAEVPIVAFEGAGGFCDLLSEGCGILVPAFDTAAMAEAVKNLIADTARSAAMGAHGRALVTRDFSFRHYLHDLLALGGLDIPRVSVIVPNYNYARYIEQRIATICSQSVPIYELIVLDDASSDDSVDVIDTVLANCPIPSTVVVNSQNSGSVFAQWRRGVELARGDYVWIAEADDLADDTLLEDLLPALHDPDIVMSYCQSRQMSGDGRILCEHYLDYVSDIDDERWKGSYVAHGRDEIAHNLHVKNTIPNVSAVLFRREALRRVLTTHGAEIASYKHAGDWVAYLRLLEHGGVAFSAASRNSHRRHQGSVTVANFNMRQLREIISVQRDAISRFDLGAPAKAAADRYAQKLYEQFGLATDAYPTFDTHPEIVMSTTETAS